MDGNNMKKPRSNVDKNVLVYFIEETEVELGKKKESQLQFSNYYSTHHRYGRLYDYRVTLNNKLLLVQKGINSEDE